MKAPKQNSNTLSARDARGLPEGNGTVGENDKQDSLFMLWVMRSCSRSGDPGNRMRDNGRGQRPRLQ